jgi:hypothetical protein
MSSVFFGPFQGGCCRQVSIRGPAFTLPASDPGDVARVRGTDTQNTVHAPPATFRSRKKRALVACAMETGGRWRHCAFDGVIVISIGEGVEFRPRKSRRFVLGGHWSNGGKSSGTNPVYYVLGQTTSGRHLFCVVIQFPHGRGFAVTARPMTRKERERYNRWKKQ